MPLSPMSYYSLSGEFSRVMELSSLVPFNPSLSEIIKGLNESTCCSMVFFCLSRGLSWSTFNPRAARLPSILWIRGSVPDDTSWHRKVMRYGHALVRLEKANACRRRYIKVGVSERMYTLPLDEPSSDRTSLLGSWRLT